MNAGNRKYLLPITLAILATLPGIYLHLANIQPLHLPFTGIGNYLLHAQHGQYAYLLAITSGVSVLGASFLLLWACDAVQEDISQTLALAIVALIAVLPEYAVDMYITWQAGHNPEYAHYAIANMTGANRIIIGLGWAVVVAIYWFRTRKVVKLGEDRKTELFFLALATVYAFVIVLKGKIEWYDGLIYFAIYAWYIRVAGRRPCVECEAEGPAIYLLSLPAVKRRLSTALLFLFAAFTIMLNAEQFSESLLVTGGVLNIPKATLIQWLAPIASEAPEFTVAVMFALRKRAGLALGSLLSSKLNQWTLLVGMIPWVYALSHGSLSHPMPMDAHQMQEILLTAAQSLLGIIILATMQLSIGQALLIFLLFIGQLILPSIFIAHPNWTPLNLSPNQIHPLFSIFYFIACAVLLLDQPGRLKGLWQGTKIEPSITFVEGEEADDASVANRLT